MTELFLLCFAFLKSHEFSVLDMKQMSPKSVEVKTPRPLTSSILPIFPFFSDDEMWVFI
jgi:hypothetical protein